MSAAADPRARADLVHAMVLEVVQKIGRAMASDPPAPVNEVSIEIQAASVVMAHLVTIAHRRMGEFGVRFLAGAAADFVQDALSQEGVA